MKHFLSFHTIFIVNENVKWLEEFILYYKHIGFDHFYLYDNEGSGGRNGGTNVRNKYGFAVSTTTTPENAILFNSILEKYKDIITYEKWQPKASNGVIEYKQNECINHFITNYGKDNEWIAFFDLDEFIFSEQNINLPEYLKELTPRVSCVKLIQKKFLDRFLTTEKYITQEFNCINDLKIDTQWGPKNIIRCSDLKLGGSIHKMNVKYTTVVPDTTILRFNHYNLNNKLFSWMRQYFKSKVEFKINGTDNGMLRYKDIFTVDHSKPLEETNIQE